MLNLLPSGQSSYVYVIHGHIKLIFYLRYLVNIHEKIINNIHNINNIYNSSHFICLVVKATSTTTNNEVLGSSYKSKSGNYF